jgi:hypothetical protein
MPFRLPPADYSQGDDLEQIFRNGPALLLKSLDIQVHGFPDIVQGLFAGSSLADAARQTRTFHYPKAVFAGK